MMMVILIKTNWLIVVKILKYNLIIDNIDQNSDNEVNNVVDKNLFVNMDEDGNDLMIDNSEENNIEVEGNVAAQGNIDYQILGNLYMSVEEALAFFSPDYFIVSASIYIKSN